MKKILIVIAALVVFGFLGFLWTSENFKAVSSNTAVKDFLIPKGYSASQIGDRLQSAGLIRNALIFKFYIKLAGRAGRIQAGEYRLSPSYSLFRLVDRLLRGPEELWVTVPEGLRREEIVLRFVSGLEIKDANSFITQFLIASKKKEGYLFPETYLFPRDASASAVVAKMLSTFDQKVDDKMRNDIAAQGKILDQVIIMASIIERETKTAQERPIVAGILYKRLKLGMPLQVDASIQYVTASQKCAIGDPKCEWWPPTTIEDRSIKSPFNTYKYPGLPPSPIANPGLSSIRAAIYPQDSDYLYYIHDLSGQIHYATTLEEHNANVVKYLR